MNEDQRVLLTADEALALLPEGDDIHTFRNPGAGMMLGADWRREKIEALLRAGHTMELGGEMCTRMGHGLVVWDQGDQQRPLFVATRETSVAESHP